MNSFVLRVPAARAGRRIAATAALLALLGACGGSPSPKVAEPDEDAITRALLGPLADEIANVQEPGPDAPAMPQPIACEVLTRDVAEDVLGSAVGENPQNHMSTTIGSLRQSQCDWRTTGPQSPADLSLFLRHNRRAGITPEQTRRDALENMVRDRAGAEPVEGIGNWAVIDMERSIVVAGDRYFFHLRLDDGSGKLPVREILETTARKLSESLAEFDG
jgi:hypothetical protein